MRLAAGRAPSPRAPAREGPRVDLPRACARCGAEPNGADPGTERAARSPRGRRGRRRTCLGARAAVLGLAPMERTHGQIEHSGPGRQRDEPVVEGHAQEHAAKRSSAGAPWRRARERRPSGRPRARGYRSLHRRRGTAARRGGRSARMAASPSPAGGRVRTGRRAMRRRSAGPPRPSDRPSSRQSRSGRRECTISVCIQPFLPPHSLTEPVAEFGAALPHKCRTTARRPRADHARRMPRSAPVTFRHPNRRPAAKLRTRK